MVTHNFLSPLITAAALHLDTSIPNFITQEYSKGDESEKNAVFKTDHRRERGYIPISNAPGLGVELDETLLAEATFPPMNQASTLLREDGSVAFSV